jgi:hypothetical protein
MWSTSNGTPVRLQIRHWWRVAFAIRRFFGRDESFSPASETAEDQVAGKRAAEFFEIRQVGVPAEFILGSRP